MRRVFRVAILLGLGIAPVLPTAFADVLLLSNVNLVSDNPEAEEISCSYTKDGKPNGTGSGAVITSVTYHKSILERFFSLHLSASDQMDACPKSVYRSDPQQGFNTCVLEHMRGVTSDLATVAVKESCVRQTEAPLPANALQSLTTALALFWTGPFLDGRSGLYVTINNNSGYTVTELLIGVLDKKTNALEQYTVRSFPMATPGAAIIGLPKDPSIWVMIPPGVRTFYTTINQVTSDKTKWGETYDWAIVAAKGFRD